LREEHTPDLGDGVKILLEEVVDSMPVTPTVASNGMTVPLLSALRTGKTLQCDNLDDIVFNTEFGEASNVPPSPKFPNQSIQLVLPTSF